MKRSSVSVTESWKAPTLTCGSTPHTSKLVRTDSVASTAVVIAVGVNGESGEREVLGFDVGPSEDGAFWTSFLRSLVARGLCGVRLVTSDAHRGLKRRRCGGPGRSLLAEVSGSFHEERSISGPQGSPADGGRNYPHRLRPTRRFECPPAVAKGLGGLPASVFEAI